VDEVAEAWEAGEPARWQQGGADVEEAPGGEGSVARCGGGEMTVLEKLDNGRIFGVELTRDYTRALFSERCDDHFKLHLTKYEMNLLIYELQCLRNEMEEDA
jgi:hypothetical protein